MNTPRRKQKENPYAKGLVTLGDIHNSRGISALVLFHRCLTLDILQIRVNGVYEAYNDENPQHRRRKVSRLAISVADYTKHYDFLTSSPTLNSYEVKQLEEIVGPTVVRLA